jgi:AcrR family transcriptional regulator
MSKDTFSDKLIEKAAEVFNQFGYKKTTMDEIAMQLGKGKSSIYYYFSSKEEIFQAVAEKEALELRDEVKRSIAQATDSINKIKNYIKTRVKVHKKVNNFYNVLKNDGLSHLDFVDSLRRKYEASEIKILQDILNDGVTNGYFNLKDTYLASIAIVTVLKGLEEPFYITSSDQSLDSQLESLINILLYGITSK